MLVCSLCVVCKENNPIYIKVFQSLDDDEPLKFHYISHAALDIIEEKVALQRKTSGTDMFLGLLFPIDVYKVYGHITSSQTKFILITDESEAKENDMKGLLQRVHSLYVDVISNPFYNFNSQINCKSFDEKVQQAFTAFCAKYKS